MVVEFLGGVPAVHLLSVLVFIRINFHVNTRFMTDTGKYNLLVEVHIFEADINRKLCEELLLFLLLTTANRRQSTDYRLTCC